MVKTEMEAPSKGDPTDKHKYERPKILLSFSQSVVDRLSDKERGEDKESPQDARDRKRFRLERLAFVIGIGALVWTGLQTRHGLRLTRDALKDTRRAERPWVALKEWGGDRATVQLMERPRVTLLVQNSGHSPALDVKYCASADYMEPALYPELGDFRMEGGRLLPNEPRALPKWPDCSWSTLKPPTGLVPEASLDIPCEAGRLLTQDRMAAVERGEEVIVCHGWIFYRDPFDESHKTHFCIESRRDGHTPEYLRYLQSPRIESRRDGHTPEYLRYLQSPRDERPPEVQWKYRFDWCREGNSMD